MHTLLHYSHLTPHKNTSDRATTLITATIGVPVEMFGFISCQMVGFCHVSRKDQEDWDDGEREYDEDGNRLYFPYTPKEVEEDESEKHKKKDADDDDTPGEGSQWSQEDWIAFAEPQEDENNKIGCRNIEGHLRKGDLPHQLELFFPADGMRHCTKLRFFSDAYFNAPLPCVLPESITKEQNLLPNSAIAAGKYLIQRVAEGFLLVVDIA
jgi:actin-related protein